MISSRRRPRTGAGPRRKRRTRRSTQCWRRRTTSSAGIVDIVTGSSAADSRTKRHHTVAHQATAMDPLSEATRVDIRPRGLGAAQGSHAVRDQATCVEAVLAVVTGKIRAMAVTSIVDTVRTFVDAEVRPVAAELEHADRYPHALVARMRELGLFGALVPATYGGLGLDVTTYARLIEELCPRPISLPA